MTLHAGNGYKPSQLNTKDNIQKTINTNTPLPPNGGGDGQVKPERRKAERIDYESFLNAYNTEVGDRLPHAVSVNEKRKRRLKKIIPQLKTPNVDGFRAYVRAFVHQAKPFYFGDNDTGWTADFDYLLREDSLTGVREAAINAILATPLDKDKPVTIRITDYKRNLDQNAKFHAMVADIARQVQWRDKWLKPEQWKVLLISGHAVATKQEADVLPGLEGEYVNIRESSAQMSVKRMASLIEYTTAWAIGQGVRFTDRRYE